MTRRFQLSAETEKPLSPHIAAQWFFFACRSRANENRGMPPHWIPRLRGNDKEAIRPSCKIITKP
jgi:hypothetical protein